MNRTDTTSREKKRPRLHGSLAAAMTARAPGSLSSKQTNAKRKRSAASRALQTPLVDGEDSLLPPPPSSLPSPLPLSSPSIQVEDAAPEFEGRRNLKVSIFFTDLVLILLFISCLLFSPVPCVWAEPECSINAALVPAQFAAYVSSFPLRILRPSTTLVSSSCAQAAMNWLISWRARVKGHSAHIRLVQS